MTDDTLPISEQESVPRRRRKWGFGQWFAATGASVGASLFLMGLGTMFLPLLREDGVYCGNEAMAGPCMMFVVAPIAAVVLSFVGWVIGQTIDDFRHDHGWLSD